MDLSEVDKNCKNRHPWELSRAKCLLGELQKIDIGQHILDVGCGDRFFDNFIENQLPNVLSINCIDTAITTNGACGKQIWGNDLDANFETTFDAVFLLDVLEHVDSDDVFLKKISDTKLKKDGIAFITVPAIEKLYSTHDKDLGHFRRYNRKTLHKLIESSGFRILDESYFYTSLMIVRALTRNMHQSLNWSHTQDSIITKIAENALTLDFKICRALSKAKIFLPGLSLLVIAQKI